MIEMKTECKIAWWLMPYIYMLAVFFALTGRKPSEAKLERVIRRAMYIRFYRE